MISRKSIYEFSLSREFNRKYHLPEGLDPQLVESTLTYDGMLIIRFTKNENIACKSFLALLFQMPAQFSLMPLILNKLFDFDQSFPKYSF